MRQTLFWQGCITSPSQPSLYMYVRGYQNALLKRKQSSEILNERERD